MDPGTFEGCHFINASSLSARERKFSTSNLPDIPREASKFLPGEMVGVPPPEAPEDAANLQAPLQPDQSNNNVANLENVDPNLPGPSGWQKQVSDSLIQRFLAKELIKPYKIFQQ